MSEKTKVKIPWQDGITREVDKDILCLLTDGSYKYAASDGVKRKPYSASTPWGSRTVEAVFDSLPTPPEFVEVPQIVGTVIAEFHWDGTPTERMAIRKTDHWYLTTGLVADDTLIADCLREPDRYRVIYVPGEEKKA